MTAAMVLLLGLMAAFAGARSLPSPERSSTRSATLRTSLPSAALPGLTAATKSAAYSVGIPLFQLLSNPGNGTLFLFAKVDASTAVFAQSVITWRE